MPYFGYIDHIFRLFERKTADINAKVLHETKKAYLVEWVGYKVWWPKSHCKLLKDGRIRVSKWLLF